MVLKMEDVGKCGNLSKLPKTVDLMLINGFLTVYRIGIEDIGRISNSTKSADFEQKAWALAHGFEHSGFLALSHGASLRVRERRLEPRLLRTQIIK